MPDEQDATPRLKLDYNTGPIEQYEAEGYQVIYANTMKLGASVVDIQMTLSRIVRGGDKIILEDLATVIMAPSVAKLLSIMLPQHIEAYEVANGLIHMPKSLSELAAEPEVAK